MTTAELIPVRREVLLDERGDVLRATWHPAQRRVVLSEWHGDVCRATFQLDATDTAKLASFLVAALGDAAVQVPRSPHARVTFRDGIRARLRRFLRWRPGEHRPR